MSLSRTQIVNWLTRCGDIFSTESEYLTGLDREIGDADHGLNMNRGFSKVVEKLPAIADKDIGFILKNTGMTLLSSVGGASGPLFGTFFIRAAQTTQARQSLTLEELYAQSNLRAFGDSLAANPKVRVVHSADDFLLSGEDRRFLDRTCGGRLVWFDCGGHLGNLYVKSVQQTLLDLAETNNEPVITESVCK